MTATISSTLAGWLALALVAGLAGAIVVVALRRGAHALALVTLFLGHLVLPRQVLLLTGADGPIPATHWGAFVPSLVVADLVLVAWLALSVAGYLLLAPVAGLARGALPRVETVNADRLMLAALVLTGLGVLITLVLVAREGSVAGFMHAVKIEKRLAGAYVLRQIPALGALLALLAVFARAVPAAPDAAPRRLRRLPPGAVWPAVLLVCVNLAMVYVWANRTIVGLTLLTAAAAYALHIRPLRLWEMVLGVAGAIVFFQALRLTRDALLADAAAQDVAAAYRGESALTHLSLSLHWARFDGLMLALRDAGDAFDFRRGQDFLNGLVASVPRQIWPDKPFTFHVGRWFRQVYEPDKINGWPVTPVGAWYVNFGAPGLVIGGLATGLFARTVDAAYADARLCAWSAVMLPAAAFLLVDGGVNTGLVQLYVLTIVPLWLLAPVLRCRPAGYAKHGRPHPAV